MTILKSYLLPVAFILITGSLNAQKTVYKIISDSVKITNCDSSELIIENHTQGVKGFLYNTGNGRTIFRPGVLKINGGLYLIGADTLNMNANAWMKGGNLFGTTGVLGTLDSNHVDLYTNSTQRARLMNNGRLLLGTSTDNAKDLLQVNGSVLANYLTNFTNTSQVNSGFLRLKWAGGDGAYMGFYYQGNSNRRAFMGTGSDSRPFILEDSVGVSFRNSPTVYVGSENGWPTSRLSVVNPYASTSDIFSMGRILSDGSYFRDMHMPRSGNVLIGKATDAGQKFQVLGDGIFDVSQANQNLTVKVTGTATFSNGFNFNVTDSNGTSNSFGLKLTGNNYSGARNLTIDLYNAQMLDFSSAPIVFEMKTTHKGGLTNYGNTDFPIALAYNSTSTPTAIKFYSTNLGSMPIMTLMQTGYVGIGTLSPAAQLHTTGTVRFAGLTSDTTQTRILVSDASGNLYYRSAASLAANDILRSSLAVNGEITAKKLRIRPQGWADYVFDSSYRLPPLEDLGDYIRQHKHLPGIASAAEVAASGVDVGENQTALLRKIEELTLYALGQDKRIKQQQEASSVQQQKIDRQSTEIEKLKKEMDELRKLILHEAQK